ncbi:MAG: hypothetical protein K2R98_19365 [Gemmataceae bacterium]|nr:hypothetical protein [Gemmataceae bacterium]
MYEPDSDSQGTATRPGRTHLLGRAAKKKRDKVRIDGPRTEEQQRKEVDLLAILFDDGRDLWTGERLQGKDAEDWLHLAFNMQEPIDTKEEGNDE